MTGNTDTKQRLIDTALELIWTDSYGSVSVDDICKAADVKKGSFYHFFPSKVDLAVAAMDETSKIARASLDKIFSASVPPLERFTRYADFTCEMQADVAKRYGQVCGCPLAAIGSEMACQEDPIRRKFDDLSTIKVRYFESALRDMVAEKLLPEKTDVKALAQELYAYLLGQLTLARIQNDLEPLKCNLKCGMMKLLGVTEKATRAA
ncbi:MAG: TetR/AcrR family transcriptional regulator [Alphaproteobacteria bacterium]|nr:MAG: TetR/AcrR family transcriptional regulator [Alphaproteobacteria bacterium]